jgi:DNA-binding XRE family transcriptional regulator
VKKSKKQEFSNNVKMFRHQTGMRQKDLAREVHSSRRQIGRIEDGEIDPDDTLKKLIADALASTVRECFPPEGAAPSGSGEGDKSDESLDASGSVYI